MKLCLICLLSLSAGCFGEALPSDAFRTNSNRIGEAGSDPTNVDNVDRTHDNTSARAIGDTAARDDGGTDPKPATQSAMAADAGGQDTLLTTDPGGQDAMLAADGRPHADGATAPAMPAADAACKSATGSPCVPCGATVRCDGSPSPPPCPPAIFQLTTANCQGVPSSVNAHLSKAQKEVE